MDYIFLGGVKIFFGKERCEDSCKDRWKNGFLKLIYDVYGIFNLK